ncbi:RAP1 GTPase activating protein 2 [Sarotherodon galilaeus]
MNSRREITFSGTATANLFECLVISGSPATGYLHAASFRDVRTLQMGIQLLRDMWTKVDGLYIPKSDLESLHAMEYKRAGSHTPDIPQCIAVDTRKLARYYIYLLFRYCVSAAEHGSAGRVHKEHTLHLTDIPTSWMQSVTSTNFPSAPTMMITHQSVPGVRQQQQPQPIEMTQMNSTHQHEQRYNVTHDQEHLTLRDFQPQQQHQHQQLYNPSNVPLRRTLAHEQTAAERNRQLTSTHKVNPEIPPKKPCASVGKRPHVQRRLGGAYQSAVESEDDD